MSSDAPKPELPQCQVCGDGIAADEAIVYCAACGTPHHRACWEFARKCSTYACDCPNWSESPPNLPAAHTADTIQIDEDTPVPKEYLDAARTTYQGGGTQRTEYAQRPISASAAGRFIWPVIVAGAFFAGLMNESDTRRRPRHRGPRCGAPLVQGAARSESTPFVGHGDVRQVSIAPNGTGIAITASWADVRRTTNFGMNWSPVPPPEGRNDFGSLWGVSVTAKGRVAYLAGGQGKFFASRDGGKSFRPVKNGTSRNFVHKCDRRRGKPGDPFSFLGRYVISFADIHFVSADEGFAIHFVDKWHTKVLATTNGGRSWTQIASSRDLSGAGRGVRLWFQSNKIGWMACAGGYVYATRDGGYTWRRDSPFMGGSVFSVCRLADGTLVCAGRADYLGFKKPGARWQRSAGILRRSAGAWIRGVAPIKDREVAVSGSRGSYRVQLAGPEAF